MTTTLFTNAHIATGEPGSTAASTLPLQDILVTDGVFTAFGPGLAQQYEAQGGDPAAIEVVDLGGKLVCPPFCDTHLHLDYVFTARKPGAVNESGTLFEGIQRWSETKSDLTVDEIKQRAKIGIKKEMLHGVQLIRSHADVTDPNLTSLKALLELKEELKDTVTLQIVSFPQEGMYPTRARMANRVPSWWRKDSRWVPTAWAASPISNSAVSLASIPCTR